MNKQPKPKDVEAFIEIFSCFICTEKLNDAHMCPRCSKLCCYDCINRWLTDQRSSHCPHCRGTLYLHEVVKCRWVENVAEQFDCLNNTIDGPHNYPDLRCDTHDKRLTVFCVTCDLIICHRCALFDSSTHDGHEFRPIEEVYHDTLMELVVSSQNLRAKEDFVHKEIKQLDKNVEEVRKAKERKVRDIRMATESIIKDIEKELSTKVDILTDQKHHFVNEAGRIENILLDCDLQVARMPMALFVRNFIELQKNVTGAAQIKEIPVIKHVEAEFHSDLVPKFDLSTFTITSFSERILDPEPIYSPSISFYGITWRLKVVPYGNGTIGNGFLSAFIEFLAGPPEVERSNFYCRIEVVNNLSTKDESKNELGEFTAEFKLFFPQGFPKLIKLLLIMDSNKGFLLQDSITFKFGVRPLSYLQKCDLQELYLSRMESEKSIIFKRFEELKRNRPEKPSIEQIAHNIDKIKDSTETMLHDIEHEMDVKKLKNTMIDWLISLNETKSDDPSPNGESVQQQSSH